MDEATFHASGKYTGSRLLEMYIRPSLENRRVSLIEKVEELLWPSTRCHPMTAHSKHVNLSSILPESFGMVDTRFAWTRHARSEGFTAEHLHAAYVLD